MSSSYITISYHIISYLMFFYFISSADLISILLYSSLFYFIWNWFDSIRLNSILFDWIRFTILFSIVFHTNEWFVSVYLSVCSSVSFSVWKNIFLLFSFFSHKRLPHSQTYTDTHTSKYIWIYVSSYGSYILLQRM